MKNIFNLFKSTEEKSDAQIIGELRDLVLSKGLKSEEGRKAYESLKEMNTDLAEFIYHIARQKEADKKAVNQHLTDSFPFEVRGNVSEEDLVDIYCVLEKTDEIDTPICLMSSLDTDIVYVHTSDPEEEKMGWGCGHGHDVCLERTDGVWVVKNTIPWQS